jgi:histidinol-phosphate/aromatic aminotransferase/cobyric acid decarboxylase-like protein
MLARLAAIGVVPVVAGGTFVVVDVGDARSFAAELLRSGVRVRDCASFGLPAYVRLGVRGDDDVSRLLAAWQATRP